MSRIRTESETRKEKFWFAMDPPWTDTSDDDYISRRLGSADAWSIVAYILVAFLACILCVLFLREEVDRQQERLDREAALEREERAETRARLRAEEAVQAMEAGQSREDYEEKEVIKYMALFSDAIETKKQQAPLLSSQLFKGDPSKSHGGEMKKNDENLDTINSALSSSRSIRKLNRPIDADDAEDRDEEEEEDDCSVISKNKRASGKNNSTCLFHPRGHGFDRNTKKTIGVHCTVCLDDIEAGETMVWSKTESCPHIFHKKCLVTFLAYNKKAQLKLPPRRRQEIQNPCPTCRQSFVTMNTVEF